MKPHLAHFQTERLFTWFSVVISTKRHQSSVHTRSYVAVFPTTKVHSL